MDVKRTKGEQMKLIKYVMCVIPLMLSNSIMANEVVFYDYIKIKDLMYKGELSENYFEKIECGSYHCYGIKDKNLFAVGFNSQGQLGTNDTESKKNWVQVVKGGVINVVPSNFGGCVYLDNGLIYETGQSDVVISGGFPKKIKKWTQTKECN